jgi:hypothetical protein
VWKSWGKLGKAGENQRKMIGKMSEKRGHFQKIVSENTKKHTK